MATTCQKKTILFFFNMQFHSNTAHTYLFLLWGRFFYQKILKPYILTTAKVYIIYNEKLKSIPKILETPYIGENDEDKERIYPPYKFEIEMLKNKKFNTNLLNDIRDFYKNNWHWLLSKI